MYWLCVSRDGNGRLNAVESVAAEAEGGLAADVIGWVEM